VAAYDENNNKDKKFQSTCNLGMGARIIGDMGNLRFYNSGNKANSRKHYASCMADFLFVN